MIEAIKTSLLRDIEKLKIEIESYKNPDRIWVIDKNILNSAGNLCLHLLGNLNHFIGAVLGNSGYVRNRDEEFTTKNISVSELTNKINETIKVVDETLKNLKVEKLNEDYPILFANNKITTGNMLINIVTHFNYHLGQINYHRRLLD
jgi:uncharacterized damage-inducible protein DinB